MFAYNMPNEERRRWADMLSDESDTDNVSHIPTVNATVPKSNTHNTATTRQPKKRGDKTAKPWGNWRDKPQWLQRGSTQTTVAPASSMGSITTVEDTSPQTDTSPLTDTSLHADTSPRIDASSQTPACQTDGYELRAKQTKNIVADERARHSAQTERLMGELHSVKQDVEKEKTQFSREQQAWEQERKQLLEDMAAAKIQIERDVTERVASRFQCELRVKAEATEGMRAQFEETYRELRDTVRANGTTLKQVKKDHNTRVQKLQAKIDAALARLAQPAKKPDAKQMEVSCDLPTTVAQFQELNRKLIQRLHESVRQKKDLEEQIKAADNQLDVQSAENGTQSRQIKDLEKRIREALVHKTDAVGFAERFHEQNKELLLERKALSAQVQRLHKQVNWKAWNKRLLDTYGSAKKSFLIRLEEESGSTTDPIGSSDTYAREDADVSASSTQ
eukprot:GEMP01007307.1.p1 GENE.GEMP01007307.1~~GEMP01007307.1.p1  ORF type:complete len:448 (+),score=116.06 GEMP01007307.1:162-1505(+)